VPVKLLNYTEAAGCAGKACQQDLYRLLSHLPRFNDPRLFIGNETADDAGVYLLNRGQALVLTVDVLGPIVNDPFTFGQIAAANSISDIYAMGGKPLACLSVLGFPVNRLKPETVRSILAGAISKVREADAVIAGGHTFKNHELKFGLAVIGTVNPHRVITNAGARPGDLLVLTKPLGTGIITTALKAGKAPRDPVRTASWLMCTLNRTAAEIMVKVGVNAATDITGFGLLGHAWELANASRVNLIIESAAVDFITGVTELAAAGFYPLGTLNNYRFVSNYARFRQNLDRTTRLILCDAQTSGGLLISVAAAKADRLVRSLTAAGISTARIIGRVEKGNGRLLVN
jgi:selenide,water dikinase